ncbi:MAG: UvrD-helicase domain-containing protein [Clostridia bacterium]|nr:UvrD-helicase domain-containing protein [Clostridia bacterium]
MNWTPEQRAAIETPGSLIVSAAAGAGKTAVLAERIASRVAAGAGIDRMLVLTFTRAAAAEMKNRIARRLRALSAEAETDGLRRRLLAESQAVTSACISTIHAFAARVLRRHSHALGLSPRARIGDELELAALRAQAEDELLERLGEADSPALHALLAAFGGEARALEALRAAYAFILSEPAPFAWLDAAADSLFDGDAPLRETLAFAKEELLPHIEALQAAADAAPEDWAAQRAVLDEDISRARALLIMEDYAACRAMLFDLSFSTLRFPRGTPEADKQPLKLPREALKDCLRAQQKRFRRSEEEERACMRGAARVLCALRELLSDFDALYAEKKRARALLDYNDLEHLCLRALERPEIAAEYRERFDFVAVDEYQDSNRVQEAILQRVARPDNLFLVGDVKQSIYRFRHAEPGLFLSRLAAAGSGAHARVDLLKNFRSAPPLLDCVNEVFTAILSERTGGLAYDERARLVAGGAAKGGAELHLIERSAGEEDEEAHDAVVEARFTAARIHALMREEPSLRYADIAVLLRSTTHAERFKAALLKNGVPCYAQSNGGYFDSLEVQVFLNLLRLIDNRRRDLPLLSVMRSSIGGFDESELAAIRSAHREGSYFEAAAACAGGEGALAEKLSEFFARLDRWRADSRLLSVARLIGRLLDETGFYEEMGILSGGAGRQANLDALLNKAQAFERSGARGLYAFLRHIELAGRSAAFGTAESAAADVVRLLTIHKSKGLEFPVVFVCQLGARFNFTSGREALVLHSGLGAGLRYIDEDAGLLRDCAARQTMLARIRREELAEEMRVLYVAMTRAKKRLILCGCARDAASRCTPPAVKPLPAAVLSAGSPLDWLTLRAYASLPPILHAREEFLAPEQPVAAPVMPPEDEAVTEAVRARFRWRYPFLSAVSLPAKAAVSRLDGESPPESFDPPAFAAGKTPGALAIGTAMHTVLERLPLRPLNASEARAFIDGLAARRLIGTDEAALLDEAALAWFTHTPLYARLAASPRAERELPFACAADAGALFGAGAEERVLLQGVIDACFMEDGAWVLVDYKTDAPREGDTEAALAARHARQAALYAAALESLGGARVKERFIVYLRLQRIVAC